MNVIVANRYQAMLQGLEIDVIKRMEGEFSVDELISTFQNFFFQRMILDITALKDYRDIKTLQKLSISLDMVTYAFLSFSVGGITVTLLILSNLLQLTLMLPLSELSSLDTTVATISPLSYFIE